MAMRLYTRDELEEELRAKWRLRKTDHRTDTTVAWQTPAGKFVLVPVFDHDGRYPDHIVDKIAEQLTALGENPFKTG